MLAFITGLFLEVIGMMRWVYIHNVVGRSVSYTLSTHTAYKDVFLYGYFCMITRRMLFRIGLLTLYGICSGFNLSYIATHLE